LEIAISKILSNKSAAIIKDYIGNVDERIVEMARQEKDNKLIVTKLTAGFDRYRRRVLVGPLMSVITSLPKEEMALLSEAIVELTSLRRRIESHVDTVGGPIDVAVISKGDGFIWIKRKHYFDIDLNRDFIYRKEAKVAGGGHEGQTRKSKSARIRRRSEQPTA